MGVLELTLKFFRIYLELLGQFICWVRFRYHKNKPLPPIANPLVQESALSLASKIRNQEVTSLEVVGAFIERIKVINPILNCMVDNRFDEALKEAEISDNLIKVSNSDILAQTKPFLGVPFTAKDALAVKGVKSTVGLWDRRNNVAEEDAAAITAMRNAGAIPLGVTNVPALCMSIETYNTVYGRTNNPYQTCRTPGGSSGGEGAIISACGSPLGIGSDLAGSIRIPAFFNGIFGHKPTYGIVSNDGSCLVLHGEIKYWFVQGPMCRHACDLNPMLKALAADNVHKLRLDKHVDISSLKYFYINDFGSHLTSPVDPELKEAQNKVISHLENSLGVQVKKIFLKQLESAFSMYEASLTSQIGSPTFFEQMTLSKGKPNIWIESLKWLCGLSKFTFPSLLIGIAETQIPDDKETPTILQKKEMVDNLRKELEDILGDNGVLLFPTHPTLTPYHDQLLFRPFNLSYTAIVNLLKMPATHCPLGLSSEGTPLGIQVVANLYQDHLCLALAEEIEKAFGGWVSPSQG